MQSNSTPPAPRRASISRRFVYGVLAAAVVVALGYYVYWWSWLYLNQERLIFLGDKTLPMPSRMRFPQSTVFRREVGPGQFVESWLVTSPAEASGRPSPLVVYFLATGELIDYQEWTINEYWKQGFSVLLPQYRGSGRSASGGEPSQQGIREDMIWLYDQVIGREDVDRARVLYHGKSLGGAVAADLAQFRPPAALIIESSFSSMVDVIHELAAPGFILRHPYRTDLALAGAGYPVLLMHGMHNDVFPIEHARRLRALAPHVQYHEFDAGHHDFPGPRNIQRYWVTINEFAIQTLNGKLAREDAPAEAPVQPVPVADR